VSIKKKRIGEKRIMADGTIAEIIDYKNTKDITVKIGSVNIINSNYISFKNGSIRNYSLPTIHGVGYFGYGEYGSISKVGDNYVYEVWRGMISRCYNEEKQKEYPTYIKCLVCDEWHNYQIFAKWYEDNYYNVLGEKMQLDKDILIKGNKIYSPDTCIIVPSYINSLFRIYNIERNKVHIGITESRRKNGTGITIRYRPTIWKNGDLVYLGSYKTKNEAIDKYIMEKNRYFLEVSNRYKEYIPEKLYLAMINYNNTGFQEL
jgi:hypothetical protein